MTTVFHVMVLVLAIQGLRPEWRQEICEREFAIEGAKERCIARRDHGIQWAMELASYVDTEGNRQGFSLKTKIATVGQMFREYSLDRGDTCITEIDRSQIVSREPMPDGREAWEWNYGSDGRTRQPVLVIQDDPEKEQVVINRCSAGEVGILQLMPYEFPAGAVIPSTGQVLPGSSEQRRQIMLDPGNNVSLGFAVLARVRDRCCGTNEVCRDDWRQWLAAHRSGRCDSRTFNNYRTLVEGNVRIALEYICPKIPTLELCGELRQP